MIVETLTKALTALKSCRYVSDRHSEIYGQQEYTEMDVDEAIEAIESCFKFMQNKLDMNSDPVDAFNAGYEDARNSYQSEIAFAIEAAVLAEREKQAEHEPVCCVADLDSLQRGFVLDRGYSLHDALYAAPVEPVKQEPVSYVYVFDGGHTEFEELSVALSKGKHKLYAAPVRTKDLTDDEIAQLVEEKLDTWNSKNMMTDFARAVIAADREKNK